MEQQKSKALHDWALRLCECAGETAQDGEAFWSQLQQHEDVRKEFAYYYEKQDFLCEFSMEGLTVADILVWQMDHFKAHMDRADSANRYDKDRLLLSTFRTLLELKAQPVRIAGEFAAETGTVLTGGWNLH